MIDSTKARQYTTAIFTEKARLDFPFDNLPETPVRVEFFTRVRLSGQDAFENVFACWRDINASEFIGRFLGGTLEDFA